MDTTAAAPAGEQPRDTSSETSALDGISSEDLLAALEGETPETTDETPSAEAEAPPAEPTEQPAPEPETPAATQDEPSPTEEEAPTPTAGEDSTPKLPERVSVRGLAKDQRTEIADATALIRNGEAKDLTEALAILRGPEASAPTTPKKEEGAETPAAETTDQNAPATPKTVSEIQSRIKELREERKAAKRDYDSDREVELTEQIEDLQIDMLRAEKAEESARTAQADFATRQDEAIAQVEKDYPDFANEDSTFFQLVDNAMTAAAARNDAKLADPNYVKEVAAQVASILGKTRNAPAPTPTTPSQPAARPKPTPTGEGLAPGHDSAARPSQAELLRTVQTMPREQLEDLVFTE